MKQFITASLTAIIAVAITGCASTRGYFVDRGRDARDIVTATVGLGVGAKIQCGPLNGGAIANVDLYGLRGGAFYEFDGDVAPYSADVEMICFGAGRYKCLTSYAHGYRSNERNKSIPTWWFKSFEYTREYMQNGHKVTAHHRPCYIPFVRFPRSNPKDKEHPWYYYTQIEAVVALGPSVRLGFNPGELVDFLLGWAYVDIYKDDLERRMTEIEQAESTVPPEAAPSASSDVR